MTDVLNSTKGSLQHHCSDVQSPFPLRSVCLNVFPPKTMQNVCLWPVKVVLRRAFKGLTCCFSDLCPVWIVQPFRKTALDAV